MFISNDDLSTVLDDRQLTQVINTKIAARKRAEAFAVSEAKSYLNFRYDTDIIFKHKVFDFDASADHKEGDIITYEGIGYTCVQDKTAPIDLTDTNYFIEQDNRNPILVMIIVDLLAYHLFSKVGSNKITQTIIDRYEDAIKKLKNIRMQKMNPLLPLKVIEEDQTPNPDAQTHTITILSNPKRDNYY